MAVEHAGLPRRCESQPDIITGYLAAGPGAADADTSAFIAKPTNAVEVLTVLVVPSSEVAQDAGDPTTITLESGADTIATGDNSGAAIPVTGLALTVAAAEAVRAAGDALTIKVDNDGAGAQDVSGVEFRVQIEAVPA